MTQQTQYEQCVDALFDMVWQFCSRDGKLSHSFMSAEEQAFEVLGIDNGMTHEEAIAAIKEQTGVDVS